ncbi:hypothetical protein C8R43DRAFT_1112981 [Mycena crocata]|nr:hypothetical protein C8R43DRAFT_1112981 [Mycena crocata]
MTSRVWFITGSSSGFGLLMAKKALANGDRVVATLRKPDAISDLAAQYPKDRLLVLKLDVSKVEDITAGFAAAEEAFGRIDIVFNNAGYGVVSEIEGTSDKLARDLFEVNFWGGVNVTKQAVGFFRDVNKPQGGLLMNVSSMFGVESAPGAGFYSATKYALEAITDAVAKELDPVWNIKVMILCPGYFKTNMATDNIVTADPHPAYAGNENLPSNQTRNAMIALGRKNTIQKDASKLIDRLWDLSKLDKPPYRVAFGDDAKATFTTKWQGLKADLEASEEWSKDLTF